jgi:hypothetical protein
MKYIFKQIDDISGANTVTTVEFSADTLSSVLEQFELFLRGVGFYPSGTLDFVDEEEYFPKFEPAEEDYEEETHEWSQKLLDDVEWPFPLKRPTEPVQQESIYEDGYESPSGSVVMDWTAAQLIRPPQMKEVCPVCKIEMETMKMQKCWDKNCPKGPLDAN